MVSRELVAASSIPLVLSILSLGESYGYAIIKSVRSLSKNELEWTDGMLYPVLHRLEEQGWIESVWRTAESGRKRKYYRITKTGLEELERRRDQWTTVNTTLEKVWSELRPSRNHNPSKSWLPRRYI
jgi:DNA-binding PadR family transcriptional regulator